MKDIEGIIAHHLARYPKMETHDLFKLIYQNELGCGHMVDDEADCTARLVEEFRECHTGYELLEPIGNGYRRLYLGNARSGQYDPALLAKVFILSAKRRDGCAARFIQKAECLTAFAPKSEVDVCIQWAKRNDYAPFSHSQTYRDAYHPAYRVVTDRLGMLLTLMQDALDKSRARPIVVGVDGRCGSGKTSIAGLMRDVLDCNVIHMDDFFLPPEMRTPERMREWGGNVHYERVESEVLAGLRRSAPFRYGVFDCGQMAITKQVEVPARPITVIEGSYALHPRLSPIYDIKVFCDIDEKAQRERIRKRNGEDMLPMFLNRWIPMEERYFDGLGIEAICDHVLHTGEIL